MKLKKLPRRFYERDTILVAKELLGKYIVHQVRGQKRIGMIVEVEAYLGPHDLASHSSKGMTDRNRAMFGRGGHCYVYFIYGKYYCFNVVTEKMGSGSAVLIRAIMPIKNISERTQGPGLLCQALEITSKHNHHDLLSKEFFIAEDQENQNHKIIKTSRIGVDYAKHWAKRLLRFYIKDNPFISRVSKRK